MSESTQKKLNRVRKPRVHITYDVETGGAQVKRELPFVVGVLGDFSGDPTKPLPSLADRKFVNIDRDNFDDVLAKMNPGLKLRVKNTISNDGSEMAVDLKFSKLEDFEPANVAKQVEPLKKLLETREKLRSLQSLADRQGVEAALEDILQKDEMPRGLIENTPNPSEAK